MRHNGKTWRDIKELRVRCATCNGQKRLWLGGKDYLDCPDCGAKGWTPVIEERVAAPPQLFIVHRTD